SVRGALRRVPSGSDRGDRTNRDRGRPLRARGAPGSRPRRAPRRVGSEPRRSRARRGSAHSTFKGPSMIARSSGLRAFALSIALAVPLVHGCAPPPPPADVPRPIAPNVPAAEEALTLPKVRFVDITKEAGITFEHANHALGEKYLPETMGSGVAFVDYDGDG